MFIIIFVIVVTFVGWLLALPLVTTFLFAVAALIWFIIGSFILTVPSTYIAYLCNKLLNQKVPNHDADFFEHSNLHAKMVVTLSMRPGLVNTVRETILYLTLLLVANTINSHFTFPSLVGAIYWYISQRFTKKELQKQFSQEVNQTFKYKNK